MRELVRTCVADCPLPEKRKCSMEWPLLGRKPTCSKLSVSDPSAAPHDRPPSGGGFLGRLSSPSQFPSAISPRGAMLHNIGKPSERHKSALT
jgi:hypothetical protein